MLNFSSFNAILGFLLDMNPLRIMKKNNIEVTKDTIILFTGLSPKLRLLYTEIEAFIPEIENLIHGNRVFIWHIQACQIVFMMWHFKNCQFCDYVYIVVHIMNIFEFFVKIIFIYLI